MKNFYLSICILLSLSLGGLAVGQDNQTPYERMIALSKEGMTDQSLRDFINSLSKKEFKRLVIEYRAENIPSPKVNVFAGMSMLAIPYYEHGAGKDDTYEEWAEDVEDTSYPSEWRHVILGHPPFKTRSLSPAQKKDYQQLLYDIFTSRHEDPVLRREALLDIKPDSLSAGDFEGLVVCLKRVVTTSDQHASFRRTALREIENFVKSAQETAMKAYGPELAEAIATGNPAVVAGGRDIPLRQKQFFTQAATLSKDFSEILEDLGGSSNLPHHLLREVKRLQERQSSQPGPADLD